MQQISDWNLLTVFFVVNTDNHDGYIMLKCWPDRDGLFSKARFLVILYRHVMFNIRCHTFCAHLVSVVYIMADRNGSTNMLNAKRNEPADRRKPFQEMLLREIPGI